VQDLDHATRAISRERGWPRLRRDGAAAL